MRVPWHVCNVCAQELHVSTVCMCIYIYVYIEERRYSSMAGKVWPVMLVPCLLVKGNADRY